MKRIKVIHITPGGEIGGRERQLLFLSHVFDKELHSSVESVVVFMRSGGAVLNEFARRNLSHVVISTGLLRYHNLVRLVKLLLTADVVNLWYFNHLVFVLALVFARHVVFSFTGAKIFWAKSVAAYWQNFVKTDHGTWPKKQNVFRSDLLRFLRNVLRRFFFRAALRRVEYVITPSVFMRSFAERVYGVYRSKVRVISNFTDEDYLVPTKDARQVRKEIDCDPNTILIGVATRLDYRKRLQRIIRAMELLPDVNAMAVIVGEGEGDERKALQDQVKKLGLDKKVIFPGWRSDIVNYIAAFDLCVLPSHHEAFGIVLLESMFLEIPSVVFADAGGPLEFITDRVTGFVVHSEFELADLIKTMSSDPESVRSVTYAGKKLVKERFGPHNATKFLDLYRDILQCI